MCSDFSMNHTLNPPDCIGVTSILQRSGFTGWMEEFCKGGPARGLEDGSHPFGCSGTVPVAKCEISVVCTKFRCEGGGEPSSGYIHQCPIVSCMLGLSGGFSTSVYCAPNSFSVGALFRTPLGRSRCSPRPLVVAEGDSLPLWTPSA